MRSFELVRFTTVTTTLYSSSRSSASNSASHKIQVHSCEEGAFGLKKSLMMDHTPKARRGRWNAVDSLQGSVWSVATMAGGYLIAADGYRAALGAMAAGFVAATCAFVPLARTR